jgi:hypothetical protein
MKWHACSPAANKAVEATPLRSVPHLRRSPKGKMLRSFHKIVARAFWLVAFLGSAGGLTLFFRVLDDVGIPLHGFHVDFGTVLAALALTAMGFVIGTVFLWQFIGQIALRLQAQPTSGGGGQRPARLTK